MKNRGKKTHSAGKASRRCYAAMLVIWDELPATLIFQIYLIYNNHVIVTEDLAVQSLMEKSHSVMSRNIGDVSWSKFINMLSYKAAWNGKKLIKIGRYEPSSKKCSSCGSIYNNLKLEERTWICDRCGKEHDRDINAAVNILKFGMEQAELKSSEARRAKEKPTDSSCG